MKTKHRQSQLWKNIIFILSLSFHLHTGLCRPARPHAGRNNSSNLSISSDLQGADVRPVYDLRHMGRSEIHGMRGERRMRNNDTLFLYSGPIGGVDDASDDAPVSDVIAGRRHRVVPFTDRNLVRKRRQPEPNRPHRRRRRKHRRVLKARERNHLSDDDEEIRLDPRGQPPLLKSDSPGYLITNASEIKKDWCRTLPLQELVSEPHCHPRVVQNNFCYGQCNSFFIPYTARTDKKEFFQSCAFCKPLKQHWGNITLNCPGRNPPKIVKTVLFVDKCRCITEILQ